MNEAEIDLVLPEIAALVGASFTGAWQPRRDRVVVGIGDHLLLMVPRGGHARLHLVKARPPNPRRTLSFQGALRSRLKGARFEGIARDAGDRIVVLDFGAHRIELRLTGRSGGLWLIDGTRVVAGYDGPAPEALPEPAPHRPRAEAPRFEAGEAPNAAAARFFGQREDHTAQTQRKEEVERRLRAAITRQLRLREHLEADLGRSDGAAKLRSQGDALGAVLHALPKGARSAAVQDLADPELTWNLSFQAGESPGAAMGRLYAKAKRLERAGEAILERLDQAERRLAELKEKLAAAAIADEAGLEALVVGVPAGRGEGKRRPGPDGEAQAPRQAAVPWQTWVGPRGQLVLVGRSADGNRRLVFQKSRGNDWWMHVRDKPGAHVVLPMGPGQSPSLEWLLGAAQIALVSSKVGAGESADVQYTQIKHLKPIKGAPGQVTVSQEKVLHVTREAGAIAGWVREDDDP